MRARSLLKTLLVILAVLAVAAGIAAVAFPRLAALLFMGDSRMLREERSGPPPERTARRSPLLVLALDGVRRDLLYALLREGQLPHLERLLGGGAQQGFPHAHFEPTALTVLPSSTMPAWAAIFTGEPPAVNGVTGDEFFLREQRSFAAPVPISVAAPKPLAAVYVDDYVGKLLEAPTIYERMREDEPEIRIWVSMSQVYRGADRLLFGSRTVLGEALSAQFSGDSDGTVSRPAYGEMSEEVVETVADELEDATAPEVLTVYFPVIDFVAHESKEGPDQAIARYLREEVDPLFGQLGESLVERSALADRFVVVVADHGHIEVVDDDAHSLQAQAGTGPAAVLSHAGFRVRPFDWKTEATDFQSVLAYQGFMAFVYLADRSTCPEAGTCDWSRPPRYEEDVLAAAEAFFQANHEGTAAPDLKGALEVILVRTPRPAAEVDEPFSVYVGGGRVIPVAEYLRQHPSTDYASFEQRLQMLAVGPFGERAGDVLLIGRVEGEDRPQERYYFAGPERSEHGSPSIRDSSIPLIVAHPGRTKDELAQLVRAVGAEPLFPPDVGKLILSLRRQPNRAGDATRHR